MKDAVHPFTGEGFSYERGLKFWDDLADTYSGVQQGDMPQRIVEQLVKKGIVSASTDVLEAGSGPGTYSLLLAEKARSVTCVETSPRMLARLKQRAAERGLTNLVLLNSDFRDLPPATKGGTAVSALCPGTGSAEGLARLEAHAEEWCVHIMWTVNGADDLNAQIWQKLGRNYSFEGRRQNLAAENLTRMGRTYEETELECCVSQELPLEDVVGREAVSFGAYGLNAGVEDAVRAVLEPLAEDGVLHLRNRNRLRVIVWRKEEADGC